MIMSAQRQLQTREGLFSLLQAHRSQIRAFGVRRLGLFGSFGRGQQNPDSDVDVLVEFEPEKKTYDNFSQLYFFLEDLFKLQVDLVTPESLSLYLGPHIHRQAIYVTFDI